MKEENNIKQKEETGPIVENFCSACISLPLAIAGVGLAGSSKKGSYKKNKKFLLVSGLALVVLSILVAVYFLYIKKCTQCLAP